MDDNLTHELRLQFTDGAVTEEKYVDLSRLLGSSAATSFELKIHHEFAEITSSKYGLMRRPTGNQTIIIRTLPENADALEEVVELWLSQVKAGEKIHEGDLIYFQDGKAYKV